MPDNPQRISRAIRQCIEYCRESSRTVSGLAKFMAELRNSGDWEEMEIRAVESGARHILSGLVSRDFNPENRKNTLTHPCST